MTININAYVDDTVVGGRLGSPRRLAQYTHGYTANVCDRRYMGRNYFNRSRTYKAGKVSPARRRTIRIPV